MSIILPLSNGGEITITASGVENTAKKYPGNVLKPFVHLYDTPVSQVSVTFDAVYSAPTPPPPPPSGVVPNLPTTVAARLRSSTVFNDTFSTHENWGTNWEDDWFRGEKFNGLQLNPLLISFGSQGVSLGVSNNGTVGCLMNTNPQDPNSPGFQFGYGYDETYAFIPVNAAWASIWNNGQSWPNDGEVDTFEGLGAPNTVATTNVHGSPLQNGQDSSVNSGTIAGNWLGTWATYGCLRTSDPHPNQTKYPGAEATYIYWNKILVATQPTWDKGADHYLIQGIGNTNGGGTGPMIIGRRTVWLMA